jgi:pyruvate kinase
MSKTHPKVPIIGSTPNARVYSKMSFFRGVIPIIIKPVHSIEEMLEQVQKELSKSSFIKTGQQLVVIAGYPVGEINLPNFAMLYTMK